MEFEYGPLQSLDQPLATRKISGKQGCSCIGNEIPVTQIR